MDDTDYDSKVKYDNVNKQQNNINPSNIITNTPLSVVEPAGEGQKENDPSDQCKDKIKEGVTPPVEEPMNTVRLLGEPLVTHGPYTFYGALAYRKHEYMTKNKNKMRNMQQSQESVVGKTITPKSMDTPSICCCDDNYDNDDLCSCNGNLSSSSSCSSPSHSEWSVIRMNHFYAVRPWYSKSNSSIVDNQEHHQNNSSNSKSATSTATAAGLRQHHYQQSVCIGELELLWRDDSVTTETSLIKKRSGNQVLAASADGGNNTNVNTTSNNNHVATVSSDDDDGNDDIMTAGLPRRRTLPRRTRQPSAKKLEAAESYAAATAYKNHPLQQTSYQRSRSLTDQSTVTGNTTLPLNTQYMHGNVLCSVRLYVMPDQTAVGRLSGVHGEDEVLEINTWGNSGNEDRWPSNIFINGIYNSGSGVDDYGSHSSRSLSSGCSGLVLRVEDFVEWVRGGLMNNDDVLNTDVKSSESECDDYILKESKSKEQNFGPHSKLSPLIMNVKDEFKKLDDYENNKEKLDSTVVNMIKKEQQITENLENLKKENKSSLMVMDSDINKALDAERLPLAAAKIYKKHKMCVVRYRHQHHRDSCVSLVNSNGADTTTRVNKVDNKDISSQLCYCCCCKRSRRNRENNIKNRKIHSGESNITQRLIVMSYSCYCRYRAQLQRSNERQQNFVDSTVSIENDAITSTYQGNTMTRVLFCRDTYDYPAELLLEPFNAPQSHNKNTSVLVNHMAPKLKGWPAPPASWLSFRWNRVRRRIRHLEHDGNRNGDRRTHRHQRRKIKKKCIGQNETSGGTLTNSYSSTEDNDSDSNDASSATNDTSTNTTNTTSDSEGPLQPSIVAKTANKNLSSNIRKVNGNAHHNKKNLTAATDNITIVNGTLTTVPTITAKRLGVGQLDQEQPKKRRRVLYTTEGQLKQQQFNYQQSQHMHVVQQKRKLHSLNRSTPITTLQPSTTRVIHHHLPPSVTIMPVNMPAINIPPHQSEYQFNNRLQNKQKQQIPAAISYVTSHRKNNNNDQQQMSFPPVIIKYDLNNASDDNSCYKKSDLVAEIATCHRQTERQNVIDGQQQQHEDEKRQRQWLVDALRLGGLEVTAVPLETGNKYNCDVVTATSHRQQLCQRGVQFESSLSTNNEHNIDKRRHVGDDKSNTETDSVMMTVTPDVVCILNKSFQQQETQRSFQPKQLSGGYSTSTASVTTSIQQQQPNLINLNNCNQSHQPVGAISVVAAEALQEKINRAIDSLKQQHQKIKTTSVRNNIVSNQCHTNNDYNNKQQQKRQKISTYGVQQQTLLDLSVKTSKQQKHLSPSPAINRNFQSQQFRKGIIPFHSVPTTRSSKTPTNLEITIVPVTASSSTNTIRISPQKHKHSSLFTAVHNNSISVSKTMSSSSMTVTKQLQQKNSAVVLTTESPSVLDMLCVNGNREQHQQQTVSITTTTSSLPSSPQESRQIVIMDASARTANSTQQLQKNYNQKLQQHKKD